MPVRRVLLWSLLAIAVLRFAGVCYAGLTMTKGDFYYSQPPLFAKTANPTLWNSPDMATRPDDLSAIAEYPARQSYLYGPTFYLTLLPTVFLNSFHAIAFVLLVLYAVLLVASALPLTRALRFGESGERIPVIVTLTTTLLFYPTLQALIGREFEVVTYVLITIALYLLVTRHELWASAVLAYISWYKYWPLLFLFYFVARRQFKAAGVFVLTSGTVLTVAYVVFGFEHFVTERFVAMLRPYFLPMTQATVVIAAGAESRTITSMCLDWGAGGMAVTSARWAICNFSERWPSLPPRFAFFGLCSIIGAAILIVFFALERRTLTDWQTKWRTIWEVSLLLVVGTFFVHNHYYYLIVFLVPINALVCAYAYRGPSRRAGHLGALAIAFALVSAFVVPTSLLDRAFGTNVWWFYVYNGAYFYGGLLLIALIVCEYASLAFGAAGRTRSLSPAPSAA